MRDYSETVSRLRFMEEKSKALNMLTGWDDGGVTALYTDAADAIEELVAMACPHYHRNVHDRGDDSYCDVLNTEPPKESP